MNGIQGTMGRDVNPSFSQRKLLQSTSASPLTVVSTEAEFVAAVKCEASHILVEEHLDLRGWGSGDKSLIVLPASILSLRGNCAAPFPTTSYGNRKFHPPLHQKKTGQCLLLLGPAGESAAGMEHSMVVKNGQSTNNDILWIDSLYFRFIGDPPEEEAFRASRSLWMTNATIQSSHGGSSQTFHGPDFVLTTAPLYAADVIFSCWPVLGGRTAILATSGQPVSFTRCRFIQQTMESDFLVDDGQDFQSSIAAIGSNAGSEVRLERCEFPAYPKDQLLLNFSPEQQPRVFFSDVNRTVLNRNAPATASQPLPQASTEFLTSADSAFRRVQEESDSPYRVRPDMSVLVHGDGPKGMSFPTPWSKYKQATVALGIISAILTAFCLAGGMYFAWKKMWSSTISAGDDRKPKPTPPGSPASPSVVDGTPVKDDIPPTVTRLTRGSVKPLLDDDTKGSQPSEEGKSDTVTSPHAQQFMDSKSAPNTPAAPNTPSSTVKLPLPPMPTFGTDEGGDGIFRNLSMPRPRHTFPESVFLHRSVDRGGDSKRGAEAPPAPIAPKSTFTSVAMISQSVFGGVGSGRSDVDHTKADSNNPYDGSALSDPFLYTESNTFQSRYQQTQGYLDDLSNRTWVPGQDAFTRKAPGWDYNAGTPRKGPLYDVRTWDSLDGDITDTRAPVNPGINATMEEKAKYVEEQLDTLVGWEILGSLLVLGGHQNRMYGGQSVVQLVEDKRTRTQYAMKFFLSESAFREEKKMYVDSSMPLGAFLPELHRLVEAPNQEFTDAFGAFLPSCIIMERGETLDLLIKQHSHDLITGLQVLFHVAERLIDLHNCGFVHRDVKPGNIMWLPRKKQWTLIDFGCVARTGEMAKRGFTLMYAAPEVLVAAQAGEACIVATEALDAWSVGILAMQMFGGRIPFDVTGEISVVVEMITGQIKAPWEDPETASALMKPLGIFKKPVLALLARDPSERMSLWEFKEECSRSLRTQSEF